MMQSLEHFITGLGIALQLENLVFCFIGVLCGTLIGVLPGIGPVATIAMLLPVTFYLSPVAALIMLAGIYYGSQYGGSTTSILMRVPGETASVVTCLDGYEMARRGRAGSALAIAALGSFFAGIVGTMLNVFFGPEFAKLALAFGSAEYFGLMVLGLSISIAMSHGSMLGSVAMVCLGVTLGMVGRDVNAGFARLTFDIPELSDGIGFVPLAVGLFGIAEVMRNLDGGENVGKIVKTVGRLWPSPEEGRRAAPAVVRGTILGTILGILPGGGSILASFTSYGLEKRISRRPEEFGHGAVEGLAGPESANNAAAQASFIPLLTLGIPPNAVLALLVGGMMIHGIAPGPTVMTERPDLFWGLIASMLIGNIMLVIINLPLVGIWIQFLKVPYRLMFPAIFLFCCIGVYGVNGSLFEVWMAIGFGILGYMLSKLDLEPAPLMLGFVLGPLIEEHMRRAMTLSDGDLSVFVTRPLSATLLVLAVLVPCLVLLPQLSKRRNEIFQAES